MIVSLYAGGMTVRDIQHHLARTLGTELSHDTISNDHRRGARGGQGLAEQAAGGALPDPLPGRPGDQGPGRAPGPQPGRPHRRRGRPGRDQARARDLGAGQPRGRSSGPGCAPSCATAAIRDVLIVCCDGLTGFPEAIEATWPQTTVQTCTVHLIRAAMRFVSYQDRKRVAAALRPIYTAPTVDAAETELLAFADSDLGTPLPGHRRHLGERLAAVHPVPGLPARAAQDHLHHQQHREPELPAPEDHQESGALPQRRRRDQAAVAGHPRHRGQTRPPARQGEGPAADPAHRPRPAGRRRHRAGLEGRPRRPRAGLPRPARRLPHLTPFLRHGHPFPPRRRSPRGAPAAQRGRTTWTPTSGGRRSTAEEILPLTDSLTQTS